MPIRIYYVFQNAATKVSQCLFGAGQNMGKEIYAREQVYFAKADEGNILFDARGIGSD